MDAPFPYLHHADVGVVVGFVAAVIGVLVFAADVLVAAAAVGDARVVVRFGEIPHP